MGRLFGQTTAAGRDATVLIACVTVLSALIAGFVALEISRSYDDAIGVGWTRSSNLALVLEEQTRRTVQAIDLSLLSIVDTLRLAPQTPSHDVILTRRLQSRLRELPYVRAFFVIGADGFLIQDTDTDTPNVSLADRDYFRAQAENPDAGLYIGQPLRSRSTGSPWFLSMSRRITLEDGTFYGVAVAAFEPKYFARFYADISVGEGGSVALVHRSGTIIARFPEHERAVGLSIADQTLFARLLPAARTGTFIESSAVDGAKRIFSYRALDPEPLVVVVGLNTASLLTDWRRNAELAGGASATVIVTLFAGTFVVLRRRARDLIAAERLRLIEKTEALGQMTSSVAHDFNNLLTVISGNLEIVAERLREGDPSRPRILKALDAADRGGRIVAQLLAFARRQPLVRTQANAAELIEALADLLRQAARPCDLEIVSAPGLWPCEIDTGQFERAVINLVVNARDAARQGSCVTVSLGNVPRRELDRAAWPDLPPGDYVAVRVEDRGAGMSPEVLRRACEPFFTTKGEGRGTGLGLSQVFGFVRQSGGDLRIDSVVGAGTTVTLLLPRSERPPRSDVAGKPAASEAAA
jgi:signal transduction histidine kinase